MNRTRSIAIALALVGIALTEAGTTAASEGHKTLQGVVNVNTASIDDLTRIPGIGPVKATEIIRFREAHPFLAVSELTDVPGIGPKLLNRIERYLTVQGPTTLREVDATAPQTAGVKNPAPGPAPTE